MDSLDDKDRLLLEALTKNARASLVSLARDIGLSRSATHDRITRLEEKGVIAGYTIVRKPSNSPQTEAYLTVQLDTDVRDTVAAAFIASKRGVIHTHCLAGDIDILVFCQCETMADLSDLREEIANHAGVKSVHTRVILNTH
ncbi:MAG: Lrp/AsnC family transcriptional regulator [Pseudomonadota bacterium]